MREAAVDDAGDIARIQVRAWQAAYGGILPAQLLDDLSPNLREQTWRGTLLGQGDPAFTLLAEDDATTTTGFCCIAVPSRDDDAGQGTAEIAAAYVDPASWGIGVGRSLIEHGLARLAPDSWDAVTLWTFLRNAHGRAFFARCGFRLDGKHGVHEASGVKTARMRLSL